MQHGKRQQNVAQHELTNRHSSGRTRATEEHHPSTSYRIHTPHTMASQGYYNNGGPQYPQQSYG